MLCARGEPRAVRMRAPVPLPASLTLVDRIAPAVSALPYRNETRLAPSFELTRRRFTLALLPTVIFRVFWDGFLVLW